MFGGTLSLLSLVFNVVEKKTLGVREAFSFPSPVGFFMLTCMYTCAEMQTEALKYVACITVTL